MKQKLLLVSALLLSGASAFASGWELPTPPAGVDPESGNQYYIMNTGAGQFLNNGKVWFSWATTAAVANDGQLSTLNETEGVWTIQRGDGKFTFISGPADGRGEMHVDGASATNFVFQKEGNTYHILVDPADATYGVSEAYAAPKCWGWQGFESSPVNAIIGNLDPTDSNNYCEWLFLDADGYTAFREVQADYQNAAKCVFYAKVLKTAIDNLKAEYPAIDVTEETAVYENADGTKTLKDINDAIASLDAKKKKAIAEEAEKNASVQNPVDMTNMITNATFDKMGDFTGWSGSSFGAGGTTSTCAERFQMVFDTYQDLANLPNGVFMVNVDGFYRAGSANEDFLAEQNGTTYNSFVYGINQAAAADTLQAAIMHLFHGINSEAGIQHKDDNGDPLTGNSIEVDGQKWYCPNSMLDFTNYNGTTKPVSNPYYKTNSVLIPVSEGKLRIGVKNATTVGWTIVDNFGLTYYGNGSDAYALLVEDLKKNLQLSADVVCTKDLKSEYETAVAAIVATNYEEYKAAIASIATKKAEIDANVAAWKALKEMIDECKKITTDPLYKEIARALAQRVNLDERAMTSLTWTTEQVLAEIENLKTLLDDAKGKTPKGAKIIIKNYDFANGWDGWNHEGTGGNIAANAAAKCAEAWNAANFDIYQEIANLQAGVYEIQVQGFYRYKRGDDAWNAYFNEDGSQKADKPEVPAFIYMNDSRTPLKQVFEYQENRLDSLYKGTEFYTDKLEFEDPNNPGEMLIGKYIYPNDMTSAGRAFDKGAYSVSAYSVLAKTGDKLRFGMKGSSNQAGDSWAIFTRFILIYQAYDATIINNELAKNVEKINTATLGNNVQFEGQFLGKDIKAEADSLYAAIQAYIASSGNEEDGEARFNALSELYALVTKIDESMALFANLHEKLNAFNDAYENYADARESVRKQAEVLLTNTNEALAADQLTDAEAEAIIESINVLTRQLAVPGSIDEASDENPADITGVIINNSFEEGNLNGWTVAQGTGDTGAKDNSNATYTISNADGSYVFNTWSGSAIEGGFFVSQDIEGLGLPKGTYELRALLASDADNVITLSANNAGKEATMVNDKSFAEEVSVFFKIEENEKITIKAASETWFKADYFQLYYFGQDSSHDTSIKAIEENAAAKEVEFYSVSGSKNVSLQQGINIVRRIDAKGNVKTYKVIVR